MTDATLHGETVRRREVLKERDPMKQETAIDRIAGAGTSAPAASTTTRLARYAAAVAATGASTLAHAAIVSSTPGIVATVNTTTAQQGYTSGPGGITWGQTMNTVVFAVNGRNFSIQAFNKRTAAVPRMMGGAIGAATGAGVAAPNTTGAAAVKFAQGAVVGNANTFIGRTGYGGLPALGVRWDKGLYTSNPPAGGLRPGVDPPTFGTRSEGNFISTGGEIRGYVGFTLAALTGPVSTMFGYFDVGYNWMTNTVTVYSWSYDDQGNAITINPSPVPGGAGLAALAFGAAGLRGRRRARN